MNKRLLCFLLACCMATLSFSATLRVSNVSGVQAPYTTISAAITAATAGDIILVEGSPNSYGSVSINKQVTIMGAGNFLSSNSNTQANQYESSVSSLSVSASGVTITGMYIAGSLSIGATNALIKRNRIELNSYTNTYLITVSGTNALFEQNFIKSSINHSSCTPYIFLLQGNTNTTIRNNYIHASNPYSGCSTSVNAITSNSSTTSIVVLQNNVITGNVSTYSSTVFNNILISGTVSGSDNTYSNNLCNSNQFAAINGNVQGVDMSSVFISYTASNDNGFRLKTNSLAIGKGVGGGDCGMFSADTGGNPYILSTMPQTPSIYQMTINPSTATSTIQLNIKAASH